MYIFINITLTLNLCYHIISTAQTEPARRQPFRAWGTPRAGLPVVVKFQTKR